MAEKTGQRWPVHGKRLDPSYPYIEAEVRYGVRREQAMTATDVIARRTRLSFLNAQAALEALPRVIDIMAEELGWNKKKCNEEFEVAKDFLRSMGRTYIIDSFQTVVLTCGTSATGAAKPNTAASASRRLPHHCGQEPIHLSICLLSSRNRAPDSYLRGHRYRQGRQDSTC